MDTYGWVSIQLSQPKQAIFRTGFDFKRAMEVKDEIEVRVYADYPKEIQERRRKLWPRLKQAREDGKRAFFDKKEPDKLIVNGHLVT